MVMYILRLLGQSLHFGIATRRYSVVLVLVLGFLLVALTATAQAAAPVLIYPFA